MREIKRFGTTDNPSEFIGTEIERDAKVDNVVGDVFYSNDGAGKLLNAAIWNGSEWDLFEVYYV